MTLAVCTFSGCGRRVHANGLCSAHCNHLYSGGGLKPLVVKPSHPGRGEAVKMINEGRTNREIADATGMAITQASGIRSYLTRVGRRPQTYRSRDLYFGASYRSDLEAAAKGGERCRCGLLAPCNDCTGRNVIEFLGTGRVRARGNL